MCMWECLRNNPYLSELDVSDNALTADAVEELVAAVCDGSGVTSLSLAGNAIGSRGALTVLYAARSAAGNVLSSLDLSRVGLDRGSVAAVLDVVAECPRLRLLYLDEINLESGDGALVGAAIAKNRGLEVVSLSGNALGDGGTVDMAEGLSHPPAGCGPHALATLDLGSNNIGGRGVSALAELLRSPSAQLDLEELVLADNPVGAEGCKALARAIAGGGAGSPLMLQRLDLSGVDTGADGAAALADALRKAAATPRPATGRADRARLTVRSKFTSPVDSAGAADKDTGEGDVDARAASGLSPPIDFEAGQTATPDSTSGRAAARRIASAGTTPGEGADGGAGDDTAAATLSEDIVERVVDELARREADGLAKLKAAVDSRVAAEAGEDGTSKAELDNGRTPSSALMSRLSDLESRLAATEARAARAEADAAAANKRLVELEAARAEGVADKAARGESSSAALGFAARIEELSEEMRWMDEESAKARVEGEARLAQRVEAVMLRVSDSESTMSEQIASVRSDFAALEQRLAANRESDLAAAIEVAESAAEKARAAAAESARTSSPLGAALLDRAEPIESLKQRVTVLERVVAAAGRASVQARTEQGDRISKLSASVQSAVSFVRTRLAEFVAAETDNEEALRKSVVEEALKRADARIEAAAESLRSELTMAQENALTAITVNQQVDFRRLSGRLDATVDRIGHLEAAVKEDRAANLRSIEEVLAAQEAGEHERREAERARDEAELAQEAAERALDDKGHDYDERELVSRRRRRSSRSRSIDAARAHDGSLADGSVRSGHRRRHRHRSSRRGVRRRDSSGSEGRYDDGAMEEVGRRGPPPRPTSRRAARAPPAPPAGVGRDGASRTAPTRRGGVR